MLKRPSIFLKVAALIVAAALLSATALAAPITQTGEGADSNASIDSTVEGVDATGRNTDASYLYPSLNGEEGEPVANGEGGQSADGAPANTDESEQGVGADRDYVTLDPDENEEETGILALVSYLTTGSEHILALMAENVGSDVFLGVRTINYNPEHLRLINFAMQTPEPHVNPGVIPGTGITIVSRSSGVINFTFSPPTIPAGHVWSGVVTVLQFGVLQDGINAVVTLDPPPRDLVGIEVTALPNIEYTQGDALDLTGMVVTAAYSDGSTADVTENVTTNPPNGAILNTLGIRHVMVFYTENDISKFYTFDITVNPPLIELTGIEVTVLPYKTTYIQGDALDLTGMVVMATYSDGSTADVTAYVITIPPSGAILNSIGATRVMVSYTENGVTVAYDFHVEVVEESTLIPGDFDGDGYITYNDFLILLENLNKSGADITNPLTDLNGDGYVDYNDFIIFLSLMGNSP